MRSLAHQPFGANQRKVQRFILTTSLPHEESVLLRLHYEPCESGWNWEETVCRVKARLSQMPQSDKIRQNSKINPLISGSPPIKTRRRNKVNNPAPCINRVVNPLALITCLLLLLLLNLSDAEQRDTGSTVFSHRGDHRLEFSLRASIWAQTFGANERQ